MVDGVSVSAIEVNVGFGGLQVPAPIICLAGEINPRKVDWPCEKSVRKVCQNPSVRKL